MASDNYPVGKQASFIHANGEKTIGVIRRKFISFNAWMAEVEYEHNGEKWQNVQMREDLTILEK